MTIDGTVDALFVGQSKVMAQPLMARSCHVMALFEGKCNVVAKLVITFVSPPTIALFQLHLRTEKVTAGDFNHNCEMTIII